MSRRTFLTGATAAASLVLTPSAWAQQAKTLRFYHTHTGARLLLTYSRAGAYVPEALQEINRFLRDFRTGDVHQIDPRLLDTLYALRERAGGRGTYEIISGFRSARTNEMLRSRSGGVAQRSLHMQGKAIDVRLTGVTTARLREEALALQAGGVGFYPSSDFVHVDTGRVRFW